jgi:uncharacterized protein YcfJ
MKRLKYAIWVMLLLIPVSVWADQIEYAKVLDVTPITRTVRIEQPRRECWTEEVIRERSAENSAGGMLLGGIIGGALGNRFGRGNGNKAAIAAGAILGAGIGRDMASRSGGRYVTEEERCEVITDYREEERIDGYQVKYLYNGRVYFTRTAEDPGKRLPVRVSVTPAF